MKLVRALIVFCLLTVSLQAAVPTGTYSINELDEAKAEALKREKALAFLVSDPESTYRDTQEATSIAIKELRNYAVVVFLISKKDEEIVMPPPVVTNLRGPTMGTFDPRLVVLSADLKHTFAALGNEELVGTVARDTHRDLKKTVKAKLDAWKPDNQPAEDEMIWVRTDGRHYRGRFIEVKEERLHVISEKFGKGSLPLTELSSGSLAFAQQLAGDASGPDAQPSSEVGKKPIENWTSRDGKAVSARFVRLESDEVTVETAAGKTFTFPLERLDEKSQTRAKELAAE